MMFCELTLADRPWMNELFAKANCNSEEFNFTFCYIWRDIFQIRVGRMGDYLLLKSCGRHPSYLFPPGSGDIAPVLKALEQDAADCGHPVIFHTVLQEQKALLETLSPGRYSFLALTDYYDYVYDAQSLITLAGKKLHSKRNHINRFMEYYPDWSYEAITPQNLPEVLAMNEEWCRINDCQSSKSLQDESRSVLRAIRDFFALGLDGGLLRVGGRVVAFSMGQRLNNDTYLVHIEKAFSDIQGAYTVINQQFAEHNCQDYLYINREDDSGNEGLRKAKHSYRPVFQVEKYRATLL